MPPYLALTLGILSRLVPSLLHIVGRNLTAVGASLLFFGARRPRREFPLAALALAATDVLLTTVAFHSRFRPAAYLLTWLWYLAVPLLGRALLRAPTPASLPIAMLRSSQTQAFTVHAAPNPRAPRRRLVFRATSAILLTAGSFFLLSNGSVWLLSRMYPHTAAGLLACYAAGLPFLRNDLLSTSVALAVFLALPAPADLRARLRHQIGSPARTSR